MDRSSPTGARALIANPALEPLRFLVGRWRTAGTHPHMPGETLNGRTDFSWHEGGAFLIMHSEVDHPLIPDGVAIIGSDDTAGGSSGPISTSGESRESSTWPSASGA